MEQRFTDTAQSSTDADRRDAFLRSIRAQQPIVAELYEAGRTLIAQAGFPARAVLLAHAAREIRNRLPDAFVEPSRGFLDYTGRLKEIRPLWEPVRDGLRGPSSMTSDVLVPLEAAREVSRLIDDDAVVPEKIKARFIQMCAVVSGESVPWSGNAHLAEQWANVKVQGIAHSGASADTEARAVNAFQTLEDIILRVFEYAPQRERRVKALATAASAETVVTHLRELVTLHDVDVYFGTLSDPGLFGVLKAADAFSLDDTTLNYWPQGAYLLTIAGALPEDVDALLRSLGATTSGITRQLITIALALSDDAFVNVMSRSKWLQRNPSIEFLDPLVKALSRLADLSEEQPLLKIAGRLLRVEAETVERPLFKFERIRAKPVLDTDAFEEKLGEVVAIVARVSPVRALRLLRDLLDRVITIEGYDAYDHHGFWYADFLSDKVSRYDVKAQVTGALLDLALAVAKSSRDEVISFFDESETNKSLYRRIADAVIVRRGTNEQAAARIADITQWTYGEENRALLERGFPILPVEQQTALVEATYEVQRRVIKRTLAEHKRDESEAEELVNGAVARIFGAASGSAPEPYRSLLSQAASLEQEKPEVHAPDLQAMERLGISAVGAALEEWIPDPNSGLPGSYSVGGNLRLYVEQNGAAWLATPAVFSTIPAYFLGWALNGLDGYLRGEASFDARVVEIVDAAISRALTLASPTERVNSDIAGHIAQTVGPILVAEAKKATTAAAVEALLRSATRLHELELPSSDSARSPWSALSYGLSHPRALAVHVVGYLILAVHNHSIDPAGVKTAYDRMSQTNNLAERGALGQLFRWFAIKFEESAGEWSRSIFLSDDDDANRAAWAGYVASSNPTARTHELLRNAYRARLSDIAAAPHKDSNKTDDLKAVREQTLWHIWVFLANGVEALDDESSLVHQMITTINDADLEALLSTIGGSLQREVGDDADRLARIYQSAMMLWKDVEDRVHDGKRPMDVLSGLPQWIASPLPASWRFEKAETLSGDSPMIRRDGWIIVKAAVDLGSSDRLRALKILERILHPPRMEVLTAIQQFARPLLVDGVSGTRDESHAARQIDSFLVNNHRPSLLNDPSDPE